MRTLTAALFLILFLMGTAQGQDYLQRFEDDSMTVKIFVDGGNIETRFVFDDGSEYVAPGSWVALYPPNGVLYIGRARKMYADWLYAYGKKHSGRTLKQFLRWVQ